MKLHNADPWVPPAEYGRSLSGLTVNLLVRDIETALVFQRQVLGADVVYADPDFAALEGYGARWMLHADHSYSDHPLTNIVSALEGRGGGVELRLLGRDPDQAEAAARRLEFAVLAGAADTLHGLRETFLIDADGYVWVPSVPLGGGRHAD